MRFVPPSAEPALRKPVTALGRRLLPRESGVVLLYHRVADVSFDPWRLAVSPRRFAEQLDVIRSRFRPMALADLAAAAETDDIPRGAVALTFDDGYRDVHDNALPLLEQYGIPATVFATSGYVGRGRAFWWDELEEISLAEERPAAGHARVDGLTVDWSLPSPELYRDLWERLRPLPHEERLARLSAVRRAAQLPASSERMVLSSDELRALAAGSLVQIGAHTVTHPVLPSLSTERQLEEVRRSRADLERTLGRPVDSFSYPHGEHTDETVACVRAAGFARACASWEGPVRAGLELLALPRCRAEDWPGEQFAWRLVKYFHRERRRPAA